MKGDDPEIDTAQTPKLFDGKLALQEKIRKTFADSIPNKFRILDETVVAAWPNGEILCCHILARS